MTREFTNGHQRLPACNFLSHYHFYNIFLRTSCRFSLQTLAKFKAVKTGSAFGIFALTAVIIEATSYVQPTRPRPMPLTLISMAKKIHGFYWAYTQLDLFKGYNCCDATFTV